MKRISWKRLKFTYIEATLFVMLGYFLMFGKVVTFEKTGANLFHVQLNGQDVGTVTDPEEAKELLLQARKAVASRDTELAFLETELAFTGEEILWGEVDSRASVQERMETVLAGAVQETMHRSYTVKIDEYTVNLASLEEVEALLQAAIDKYDTESGFDVVLSQDNVREFSVLSATVTEKSEEEQEDTQILPSAGIQAVFGAGAASATPHKEMGFEDYKLGIMEMSFSQEVEIVEAYLPKSRLTELSQAIEEVTKEQELKTVYVVQAGDTLSEISLKVNIPMDQIVAMNDALENENTTIHVGDELVITVPEPELSVCRVEESYIEEIYDADVIYVDNNSWYTTQTKVLQQPSAGFRKIIALTSYVNDKEVGREIVKEEVVMEAVPKIVERGTKIPPTYIKPISGGRLSSNFGKRPRPTAGASTYHKGIDWATPTGTAVYASCGGTVAKAGWGSGYGYVVYINHEDGRQTRYAHLSKVLVKVGQTVKQGEKIALSGNTGVSSGPHVHFELLIGGKQVDPLKYIK